MKKCGIHANEIHARYIYLDLVAHESQKAITKVQKIIENTNSYDEILLSAISPWEFGKLLLVPLSPVLAYRSTALPQPFIVIRPTRLLLQRHERKMQQS